MAHKLDFIHAVTNAFEQSHFWEVNSSLASKEIPCILWKTHDHYHVHYSLPLVCIMSHNGIQYNAFHSSSLRYDWVSSSHLCVYLLTGVFHVFPPKLFMHFSCMHATWAACLILFDLIILIILGEEYTSCIPSLYSFLQPPVSLSPSQCKLFLDACSLCSFLSVGSSCTSVWDDKTLSTTWLKYSILQHYVLKTASGSSLRSWREKSLLCWAH